MPNGKVCCEECGNEVSPRLWHSEGDLLTNRLIEHICPICGVTMYSTGGGFTGISKVFAIYFAIPLVFIVIFFNKSKWAEFEWYIYLYWAVISIFIYKIKFKNKGQSDQ